MKHIIRAGRGGAAPGSPTAPRPAAQPAVGEQMSTAAILLLFIGLMVAMFMFSLNQTILATALPTIPLAPTTNAVFAILLPVVASDAALNVGWGAAFL